MAYFAGVSLGVDSYVADVLAEEGQCLFLGMHAWGGSQPALFHWETEADLLTGAFLPAVRVRFTAATAAA